MVVTKISTTIELVCKAVAQISWSITSKVYKRLLFGSVGLIKGIIKLLLEPVGMSKGYIRLLLESIHLQKCQIRQKLRSVYQFKCTFGCCKDQ